MAGQPRKQLSRCAVLVNIADLHLPYNQPMEWNSVGLWATDSDSTQLVHGT